MKTKNRALSPGQPSSKKDVSPILPTFLDHVRELRSRLFWSVGFMILAASIAFVFKDGILAALTAPLGSQALYYLTPAGGFSFIIKICTYVGGILAVPAVLYHTYRYLEPLMGGRKRPVWLYTFFSAILATIGVSLAYLVSLPAALHFLTNLDIGQIHAMLTADAYLSFVITYLLGAAILFQLPLLLLIINTVWPLPPKRLLGAMRYVIIGAFILAAIISPTPDIVNQALMALPIISMYLVGVICVWAQNRLKRPEPATVTTIISSPQPVKAPLTTLRTYSDVIAPRRPAYLVKLARPQALGTTVQVKKKLTTRRLSIDGFLS